MNTPLDSLFISLGLLVTEHQSLWSYLILASSALILAIIGRALFYVVVIPTTMPGGFFWKNQGIVEHVRETVKSAVA